MTDLFIFSNDLRLEDNLALDAHCAADKLVCLYWLPPDRPWCNTVGMGSQRRRFLEESVASLQRQLRARGQDLLVLSGDLYRQMPSLIDAFDIQKIGISQAPGVYEQQMVEQLRSQLKIPVLVHGGNTLYSAEDIQRLAQPLPPHYTPFRKKLPRLGHKAALGAARLPPPPPGLRADPFDPIETLAHPAFPIRGGQENGEERLQRWLAHDGALSRYAETRNDISGLFASSAISPWLANGSLSVRRVADLLRQHEAQHGTSEGSEHFWRELVWREFFYWRALADGQSLFRFSGVQGRRPKCCFDPRSYARWCAGDTNFPLVNALMRQLVATGWMSNRGRLLSASCLINDLNMDWRYGAAFFEKYLLDFDVASNYGNWQYLAGVGADPRGGRRYRQQTHIDMFDPAEEFIRRWEGYTEPQPDHVVDAADWPIIPA